MAVFCYRNLMRRGVVWSAKDTRSGLVVYRGPVILLRDCLLKVSAAGRRRVLREKRKNVHAGVRGTRALYVPPFLKWKRVQYNPYRNQSFVYSSNGRPVRAAEYVKLTETGCYVANAKG